MMDQQTVCVQYSLGETQSRCVINLNHTKRHLFAVGSCNWKEQNYVFDLIKKIDSYLEIVQIIKHPGVIQKLISNIKNDQIYVIYEKTEMNSVGKQTKFSCCSLALNTQNSQPIQAQFIFDLEYEKLENIICHETEPIIYLCNSKSVVQFDLQKQQFQTIQEDNDEYQLCEQDPYHQNLFVRTQNSNLCIVDIREKKINKFKAHSLDILDIDFNPNKQYYLMSAGEDCMAKIWDIRKTQYAIKTFEDLQNSVLQAKYNRFHDQLIALSFDDGTISLNNITSVSSVPQLGHMKEEDYVVKIYDEHEDSIYSLCWSNASAWILASIGFSGHLIINSVPTAEKYKILL